MARLCVLGSQDLKLERGAPRQPHTSSTGWGTDLTVRGVEQVEDGVRRHHNDILVRRLGAPQHLHFTSR